MKKNKKTKRKLNKKRVLLFFFLIVVIIIGIFILRNKEKEPKLTGAMSALDTFMTYINEKNYEQMYEMLSESAKSNITKEEFVAKNDEIYGQLEANLVTISNMAEEEENRQNKNYIYRENGNDCRNINFWKYCKSYRRKSENIK